MAEADDLALAQACRLVSALNRRAECLVTLENPVNDVFPHLPCIKALLGRRGWRLLESSHCTTANELDVGWWPQKDTHWVACGLPRGFHLPVCDFDCTHLIHGTQRHRMVLCTNPWNHPKQEVIRDPMVKGRLPLGVFSRLAAAHAEWRKSRVKFRHTHAAAAQSDGGSSESPKHESSSDDDAEEASVTSDDSAEWAHQGPSDVKEESAFDADGLRISTQVEPLRGDIPVRPVRDTSVNPWARGYPALQPNAPRWDLDSLPPHSLLFVDPITFDFRVKGRRQHSLITYDYVTGGVRPLALQSKSEAGDRFNDLITMESLDKRGHKVTVVTDGCGAMIGLVKDAALRRGVDHIPLPPYSPHLNVVEGFISRFKADVASVLLPACRPCGPITEEFVQYAIDYVAYTAERFTRSRAAGPTSAFELNVGVPPRNHRLVPFGTPGWAYVPKELRQKRKAPKYMRSEPVIMIGYQHMYTSVYKCLTAHGTVIRTEQVMWDMEAQLGVFPGVDTSAAPQEATPVGQPSADLWRPSSDDMVESRPIASRKQSSRSLQPTGIIRLVEGNIYGPGGKPRPKDYILDRIRHVEGLSVEEARSRYFPDSKGRPKRYSGDLAYDIATGWVRVEEFSPDSKEANVAALEFGLADSNVTEPLSADRTDPLTAGVSEPLSTDRSDPQSADLPRIPKRPYSGLLALFKNPSEHLDDAKRALRHPDGLELSCMLAMHPQVRHRRLRRAQSPLRQLLMSASAENRFQGTALMAMRDLPWQKYLHGEHHKVILEAYETELNSLLSTVLRELPEDHPERSAAESSSTPGRMLLEIKRQGVFKCRYVLQGFKEDKVRLDGPDFDYSSNVVGITAVRVLMLGNRPDGHAIAQKDISTAFLQSHPFPDSEPPRYVRLKDPVAGVTRYFRQLGPIYGSNSAPKH